MSSLSQVIKANSLLDSLTNIEFNQLITHFIKQCGRSALIAPFFAQYMHHNKSNHASNTQHFDMMMDIIKIIVRKREDHSNSNPCKSDIHTLPKAVIGEVASYLPQKDYVSLSKTNRFIYIGCNEPITLNHLDLKKVNNYSDIDLLKYPQLTHLEINLTRFHQLSLPSAKCILNHLSQLTLNANKRSNIDINPLISQTAINLNNITHLKLTQFGIRSHYL